MKKTLLCSALSGLLALASTGCDVEQTEPGALPDVDVDVDPGAIPAYDVDAPNVDVSTEEKKATVPDVDVETEQATVEVPDVDVDLPKDE